MPFFKTYKPPEVLSKIIRELQVYHVNWNEEKNLPPPFITCLANTEQNLYFYLRSIMYVVPDVQVEIPQPRVIVTGPKYKTVGLLFGKDHLMIKVAFYPTGTYRLLNIPIRKTVNSGLDATSIWGDEVKQLLEEIQPLQDYDAIVARINSFLEKKYDQNCRPEEPIDEIAIQMLDPLNEHALKDWASMACLSLRQFERSFISRVGISPKLFLRIVRFEHAMRIKNKYPGKSWAEISLEAGYTDSQHILKEFKKFAEFPPSKFYLQPTSGYSDMPTG